MYLRSKGRYGVVLWKETRKEEAILNSKVCYLWRMVESEILKG